MLIVKLANEVYELQGWEPPVRKVGDSGLKPSSSSNDKQSGTAGKSSRGAQPESNKPFESGKS